MLLEYGLKNFFCFKEGASVSFRLDANCPPNISLGREFTTVLCVKGANGAGKTNLLKGLAFLSRFCYTSFSIEPDDPIPFAPFFDSEEPTEFYAEFSVGNIIYLYELTITETEVIREAIYQKRAKKIRILERNRNELTYTTKKLKGLESIKLRRNASIISTARQYELDELKPIAVFFGRILSNVSYGGLRQREQTLEIASGMFHKYEMLFNFAKDFIKECDIGISDIRLVKKKRPNDDTEDKASKTQEQYMPLFVHKANGKEHVVTQVTESSGTKALFATLGRYKMILEGGGVLLLDEFDVNLHPHILPKLLNLFLDPNTNKKNAQLLFTTHNSEILNVLGRYRTYLVNKENNEAYAYRLDEIPGDILRNDRPILPAYNDGKIGGVPKI